MAIFGPPLRYKRHPDGGMQAWGVVSGVFVSYGLAFGLLRVFSVLLNPIASYYGVTKSVAMLAPGLGMLGYSMGGLMGGAILGIIGYREGSMIFGVICSIAFFICGCVNNIVIILAMIFIALFALGVVYLASPGIIGRYFLEKKTLANQVSACGVSVCQFVLSPVLAILIASYSVPGTFIIIAGLMLNIVASSALYRPTIIETEEIAKQEKDDEAEEDESATAGMVDFSIFKDPGYVLFFISQGIFFAGYMGALLCTVPYAEGDLNVDPIKASYLNSIMGICELIFRIPFGMLGDWKKMNRTILLAGTFLTLGVIFLVFPMCQEYNTLMVFAGLSGIFQGGFGGISFVVLDDIMVSYGKQPAFMLGLGLSTGFNGILGLAAPVLFGMMAESFGSQREVLYTAAVMVIGSAILTFLIVPFMPKKPKFPEIPESDFKSREDIAFIEKSSS